MHARLAIITFVDGSNVGPDNTLPSGGAHPDQGLPSGGYPSHGLPGGGQIDNALPSYPGLPVQLPVYPFDPTIDNSLPGAPPPASTKPIVPGAKFVVKWLACKGLVLVPDNSLPTAPGRPDQGLPPTAQPKK